MTEEQRERKRAYDARWKRDNPEKHRAHNARWKRDNPEKNRASSSRWLKDNPEKNRAKLSRWKKANPEKCRADVARRRAQKLRATPSWANQDLIYSFYRRAQLFGLVVDHIIPLKGRTVCGLHVEHNLQLLTAEENSRKGNKLLPEHSNPPCVFE